MGVGLTLVKAIVELHGGTVEARSDGANMGSEFTVRLPRLAHSESQPRSLETPDRHNAPVSRLRIAIVEDNADSRTTLQSLLQLDDHEVRVASDGLEGIQLISEWRPDVALVDIGLPGLDGFEVARRVRASEQREQLFLVALTGYGFPSDREKAMDAGFDRHLVKPLKRNQLRSLLKDV
jgi:CheY-like chemotaxis protein